MRSVHRAELGEVAELRRDGARELIRLEVPEILRLNEWEHTALRIQSFEDGSNEGNRDSL